jgi:hypothetical protein
LLLAELAGLHLGRGLQRSCQQAAHGRQAHVLHLGQIDIQARSLIAPALAHNDFSPALGQLFDALEIFLSCLARRHDCLHATRCDD